jgi:predicted amidohydrolase
LRVAGAAQEIAVSKTYAATVLQPSTLAIGDAGIVRRGRLRSNAEHYAGLIRRIAAAEASRIFVLPQFAMQGSLGGLDAQGCIGASIDIPGPETDVLASAARDAGVYVAGASCERHMAFPGRYFQTGFLIGPDGALAMIARKLYAMTRKTRPGDVLDTYLEVFGADSLFPVAQTPLGRIGLVVGGDLNWPEVPRCLALRGAELLLNPVCAGPTFDHLSRAGGEVVARARAFENLAYVLTANMGTVEGDPTTPPPPWCVSRIVDFNGAEVALASAGADRWCTATLDLAAMRALRSRPTANFIAQLQPSLHAAEFARTDLWPANAFADGSPPSTERLIELERSSWTRLNERLRGTTHPPLHPDPMPSR